MFEFDSNKTNDTGYKNYSVTVRAISVSWLLEPEGHEFLKAIIL